MSNVRQTSLDSYISQEDKFLSQEITVLNYIKNNPFCSDRDISEGLGLEINVINGRRNKLMNKGLIESSGKIKNKLGRSVHIWRCK